jgi:hypothetical protein
MNRHVTPTAATRAAISENAPSKGARCANRHELLCGVAAQDAIVALFSEFNDERSLNARSFAKPDQSTVEHSRS